MGLDNSNNGWGQPSDKGEELPEDYNSRWNQPLEEEELPVLEEQDDKSEEILYPKRKNNRFRRIHRKSKVPNFHQIRNQQRKNVRIPKPEFLVSNSDSNNKEFLNIRFEFST